MNLHPLFAGFNGVCPYAVGSALGFAIHVEAIRGAMPATLDPLQRARLDEGGDLAAFQFAGGWEAPGVHCLMFAKPLTQLAATWWRAGAAESEGGATSVAGARHAHLHAAALAAVDHLI